MNADSFYNENPIFHRVASIGYSQRGESVSTFCRREFNIEDKKDIVSVPISLLDENEVCIECERNYGHIRYDSFNFEDGLGRFKFFARFCIRVGDEKGFVVQETTEADSVEEAKDSIDKEYEMAEIQEYYYISRSKKYGNWEVLLDKTNQNDETD